MSYFIIEKGIIERRDLSIYEKMCCVVLAKWATEETQTFDMDTLAEEMSCTLNKAKETIDLLKQKGFIQSEEQEAVVASLPKIIKAADVEGLDPVTFGEEPRKTLSREALIEAVREMIEEPINDSEAKILLNFANDDLNRIEVCYKKAKKLQVTDNIEALMMELQRKEEPSLDIKTPITATIKEEVFEGHPEKTIKEATIEAVVESEEKRPWYLEDDDDFDDVIKPPVNNQINTHMLNKMKSYKNYGK